MRVKVLGSAAGGGFPQWNCTCRNCQRLRDGALRGRSRTQTQVAVSPRARSWFLLNASPDLRSQILSEPELTPGKEQGASNPITSVFLPSADVDSVMGLLHLREFQSFNVFATAATVKILQQENRIFSVLGRAAPPVKWVVLGCKEWKSLRMLADSRERTSFLCATVPLGGSFPDYVSAGLKETLRPEEAVCGFTIQQSTRRVFFAPSLPGTNSEWKEWAELSDLALVDGTFWSDDELIQTGRTRKTAREMGHLPLSGRNGLMEQYPKKGRGRKVLIHINNTNPILDEESSEHRAVLEAGFEIAYDGMEFVL